MTMTTLHQTLGSGRARLGILAVDHATATPEARPWSALPYVQRHAGTAVNATDWTMGTITGFSTKCPARHLAPRPT